MGKKLTYILLFLFLIFSYSLFSDDKYTKSSLKGEFMPEVARHHFYTTSQFPQLLSDSQVSFNSLSLEEKREKRKRRKERKRATRNDNNNTKPNHFFNIFFNIFF